jgi:pimeloyl-ACP methyl ester carboxylesterase
MKQPPPIRYPRVTLAVRCGGADCCLIKLERLPEAAFSVLAGVGHEPMLDDPELVARTILAVTGAADRAR